MMLIIEIHVDTIENTKTSPSTDKDRADERPTRARQKPKNKGNRIWKAIKLNIPGSLLQQDKDKR